MANNLGRVFKLRGDFEKGTARKVVFCDLWHLFRPGTTVRTPAAKQIQLYRVIRATGGRPLYSITGDPRTNYAEVKLKDQGYSPGSFIVECFYVGFDGAQYGPLNRTFQIRKYEGERDMSALPYYQLQCDPDHEKIRDAMVTRGENFPVLSNPQKTAHKQYRGLTLDKHPEQVESQVITDFQLAFLEMTDNRPQIGLDNLVDHDNRGTNLGSRVAAAAEDLDRYILSLGQGKNDSQLAEEQRWRADNFQSQPMVVPMVRNADPGRSVYAFGQSNRSSKGRGPERGAFKEVQPSDTDSDSSTSSNTEESSEPDRRHAESDESSEPESDLIPSDEDRKNNRKVKSTSKTKDGEKRSSHKRSK